MQPTDTKLYKNSLALALRQYSTAVSDMEQTVLVPSLLRDVPSDELWDQTCGDLYENYLMLKAIRNTVESGLVSLDERRKAAEGSASLEPLLDMDAESLFHFHLRGLFSVMRDLTGKTQSLTGKYKNIIGVHN